MPKFILKNKIVIIFVILILLLCSILFWQNIFERTLGRSGDDGQRKFSVENFRGESENVLPDRAILEVNGVRLEGEITELSNVYDFMDKLRNEEKIDFTEKNYIGMGKFVVAINGIKGNGDRNWIYYVNGKKSQIGVSNYIIKPGDVVSWKYEKSY